MAMGHAGATAVVLGLLGVGLIAAVASPPIPQDPAYHRLADDRRLLGVPNALNVLSNAPFVLIGALGAWSLRAGGAAEERLVDGRERWPWVVFFVALALTGVGSAYYHLSPDNERLMWDRLPLAAALMALFSAVVGERISVRGGLLLLAPLVAAGIASVLWWHAGEVRGRGDLRAYALVQFYPLVAVPAMLLLCRPRYTLGGAVLAAAAVYGVAKAFEALDRQILDVAAVVSGHTLKHLAAAGAGAVLLWMLGNRRPCSAIGRGVR